MEKGAARYPVCKPVWPDSCLLYTSESDKRQEKTGFKIREAQLAKIPYMVVIGDKEQEEGTVSVRFRDSKESKSMTKDEFVQMVVQAIEEKK